MDNRAEIERLQQQNSIIWMSVDNPNMEFSAARKEILRNAIAKNNRKIEELAKCNS